MNKQYWLKTIHEFIEFIGNKKNDVFITESDFNNIQLQSLAGYYLIVNQLFLINENIDEYTKRLVRDYKTYVNQLH